MREKGVWGDNVSGALSPHSPHFPPLTLPNHSHPHEVSRMKEKRKWDDTIGVRRRGEGMG